MSEQTIDVGKVISIAEPLVLEVIAWFRRRHADTGHPPTDDEVKAYVKTKLHALVAEADAFEAESHGH